MQQQLSRKLSKKNNLPLQFYQGEKLKALQLQVSFHQPLQKSLLLKKLLPTHLKRKVLWKQLRGKMTISHHSQLSTPPKDPDLSPPSSPIKGYSTPPPSSPRTPRPCLKTPTSARKASNIGTPGKGVIWREVEVREYFRCHGGSSAVPGLNCSLLFSSTQIAERILLD